MMTTPRIATAKPVEVVVHLTRHLGPRTEDGVVTDLVTRLFPGEHSFRAFVAELQLPPPVSWQEHSQGVTVNYALTTASEGETREWVRRLLPPPTIQAQGAH